MLVRKRLSRAANTQAALFMSTLSVHGGNFGVPTLDYHQHLWAVILLIKRMVLFIQLRHLTTAANAAAAAAILNVVLSAALENDKLEITALKRRVRALHRCAVRLFDRSCSFSSPVICFIISFSSPALSIAPFCRVILESRSAAQVTRLLADSARGRN